MTNDNNPCAHAWAARLQRVIVDVTEQGVVYAVTCTQCDATWREVKDEKLAQIALFVARKQNNGNESG
jgi:hypothetical protein